MDWHKRFAKYVPTQQAGLIDIGVGKIPTEELDEAAKQFLESNPDCPHSADELLKVYLFSQR